jgi:hypothetical protein
MVEFFHMDELDNIYLHVKFHWYHEYFFLQNSSMQGHDATCNLQQGRTRKKNQNIRITRKIKQKEKK